MEQSVSCGFWWLSETCEHNTTGSVHGILTTGSGGTQKKLGRLPAFPDMDCILQCYSECGGVSAMSVDTGQALPGDHLGKKEVGQASEDGSLATGGRWMDICYALIKKCPLRETLASFPPLLRSNESGESSGASDMGECIVSPTCRRKRRRERRELVGVSDAEWVC